MLQLKSLSEEFIPKALDKAEHYRLLNEPWQAESICRDILSISPNHQQAILQLILALSATMEGDTTNFFIYRQLEETAVKITTIARGIPVGDELEYADEVTLGRSLQDRVPFESSLKRH